MKSLLRRGGIRHFSFGHNFPATASYYFKGKEYVNDWDLEDYPTAVKVFLS